MDSTNPPMIFPIRMYPVGPREGLLDLQGWGDGQIETAKQLLRETGSVDPVFLFLAPDPEDPDMVVQGVFSLQEFLTGSTPERILAQKDVLASLLPQILAKTKAFVCVMIFEAWMKTVASPELLASARNNSLAEDPERIEVLNTMFETETLRSSYSWKIQRESETQAHTEDTPFVDFSSSVQTSGRFATFLYRGSRDRTLN